MHLNDLCPSTYGTNNFHHYASHVIHIIRLFTECINQLPPDGGSSEKDTVHWNSRINRVLNYVAAAVVPIGTLTHTLRTISGINR